MKPFTQSERILSMSDKVSTSRGGVSFLSLLTIMFIGLKLSNNIDWDWVWVLSPLWLPFVIILGSLLILKMVFKIYKKFSNTI